MIILVIVGLAVLLVGLAMLILKIWRPIEVLGWMLCMGAPLLVFTQPGIWVSQPIPLTDIYSLFGMLYALIIVLWIAAMIYHAYLPEREQKIKRKGIKSALIRRFFFDGVQTKNNLSIHEMDTDIFTEPQRDNGTHSLSRGRNQP